MIFVFQSAVIENTEIKLEEEEVKYEDDDCLQMQDACNTLEVQMVEDENSNQGPHLNSEVSSRLKYEPAVPGSGGGAPGLLSPSSQPFSHHPQSFEEIVSQALPGPSGMQGVRVFPLAFFFFTHFTFFFLFFNVPNLEDLYCDIYIYICFYSFLTLWSYLVDETLLSCILILPVIH